MDTLGIIEKKGYRRKDLKKDHREIMFWLDFFQKQVENLKDNIELIDEEAVYEDSIIGQIKKEIIEKTLDKVSEWMEGEKAEIQIGLAEQEPYEDDEDEDEEEEE